MKLELSLTIYNDQFIRREYSNNRVFYEFGRSEDISPVYRKKSEGSPLVVAAHRNIIKLWVKQPSKDEVYDYVELVLNGVTLNMVRKSKVRYEARYDDDDFSQLVGYSRIVLDTHTEEEFDDMLDDMLKDEVSDEELEKLFEYIYPLAKEPSLWQRIWNWIKNLFGF